MKVLVTGAAGFVGAALAARLATDTQALATPVRELLLADLKLSDSLPAANGTTVRRFEGSIADTAFLDMLISESPDVVFHLASIPGGAAERDPALGTAVNLHATTRLFEQLAAFETRGATRPPVVVFTSTVAVYGAPLPEVVDTNTPLVPVTSYGAHKLMTEYLLADYSRRARLDGRTVRLPGIVARPPQAGGHVSAFMSDLIHKLAAGETYTCPVSRQATCWWMSVGRCVDNLLHAARLTPAQLAAASGTDSPTSPHTHRTWPLPVLRASIGELVDALATLYGDDRHGLVNHEPVEAVEAVFGRQPPLDDRHARAIGLADDGDLATLVQRALEPH